MRTRLVPYAPFGARAAALPDALESQVVTPLGELPTASVHYPRKGINSALLDGITELGFEYHDGATWVEPPNCRFITMKGSFDHLEEVQTRKYSLLGIGWILRRATVHAANGLPVDPDGKVQFNSANAGAIMATLIANAKSRGWGAGISVDFTAAADSSGAAWSKILTIAYELDLDLEAILSNLWQQGICDYRWEGRTLRIFNPDTSMARELSTGADPVRLIVNDGQTSAPEDWTNEDLLTHATVLGEEGKRWEFTNGAVGPLGRLEKVIAQGGVSDEGTASLLSQNDLLAGSQTRFSWTREFVISPASKVWPFRQYLPGDWVSAQRGTGFERLRAVSLSLTVNKDGVKGHAVLGDRLEDLLTKLAKRTKGITGGTSAGGSGVRPAPEGPDRRVLTAPTGLVVQTDAFIDDNGNARGRVALDWAHDGKDTNGRDASDLVDGYRVDYRVNATGELWKHLTGTADTEASFSPLLLFKADGVTPEQYAFRVRANGGNGLSSAWSVVAAVEMQDDTTAPPVPYFTAADVKIWLRAVSISWGGKGTTDGTNQVDMPRDFDKVDVYRGTSPAGPWTLVGSSSSPGFAYAQGEMPIGTTWFALKSVDRSGNASAYSAVQSIVSAANVDISKVISVLDAAAVQVKNARELILVDGLKLGAKLDANDQAQATLASDVGTLRNDTLPALVSDLGDATGRLDAAETTIGTTFPTRFVAVEGLAGQALTAAGTKSITRYSTLDAPASTAGFATGDTWRKIDGANNVIAEWRVSGAGNWISQAITSAMVSGLDVGKLTAGSANIVTVVAQKIAAATASFQTVDAKNLFVTGTASLSTVVAQRLAAETATFMSIGTDQLTAGSANIATGVIDKLWANFAAIKKVTSQMIAVTDLTDFAPNLLESPTDWTLTSGMTIENTARAIEGRFIIANSTTVSYAYGPYRSVRPGERLYAEGEIFRSGSGQSIYLRYYWYDKDKNYLSNTGAPQSDTGSPDRTKFVIASAEVPAGVAYARLGIPIIMNGAPARTAGMYNIQGYKQSGTTLIGPGVVIADHITASEAMSAKLGQFLIVRTNMLEANAVTADKADIGSLTAVIITSDVFNGKTFNGGTFSGITVNAALFQTVTTANRGMKFSNTLGFRQYDANGADLVRIGSGSSNLMTGVVRTSSPGAMGVVLHNDTTAGYPGIWLTRTGVASGTESAIFLRSNGVGNSDTTDALVIRAPYYSASGIEGTGMTELNTAGVQFVGGYGSTHTITSSKPMALSSAGPLTLSSSNELRLSSFFNTVIDSQDNFIRLSQYGGGYNKQTTAGTNMVLWTDGNIFRSTSVARNKLIPADLPETGDPLSIQPRDWVDRGMAERYAESIGEMRPFTEDRDREVRALSLERIPGLIIEEVIAAGYGQFVTRDVDGNPEGLMYDRLWIVLIPIIRALLAQGNSNKADINQMKAQINQLIGAS